MDEYNTRFEQAARKLRERILSGDLPQGGRLSEVRLAKELGLSRGPVREALRRLEQERLVMSVPNRGTFVVRVMQIQVVEALEARAVLEPFAYAGCHTRRLDGMVTRLFGVLNRMRACLADGDFAAVAGLHGEFHAVLYRESGNRTLIRIWEEMESVIELHVFSRVRSLEDGERLLQHHEELARSLVEGDLDQGRRAILDHLADCAGELEMHFVDAPQLVYAAARRSVTGLI